MKPSELLDKPEKWTKGVPARTATGEQSPSFTSDAVCWCALGALTRCGVYDRKLKIKLGEIAAKLFPERVKDCKRISLQQGIYFAAAFNDHPDTTFEDVRKVLIESGL